MIKLGLFGVGHLGKIHLKCLAQTPFQIVGFFDPDDKEAEKVEQDFGIKRYLDISKLIAEIDAADIVSPTPTHFEVASEVIKSGKHLFIEKPITNHLEEARKLVELSQSRDVKIQIGHVERYNPAIRSFDKANFNPMFIEGHRLAVFNPRGTDVSVILDLMIHDIDLILHLVDSPVKSVHANGISIVSDTSDICNARITFENGCVANLTASRMSMKNMRKLRIFQKDAYISLDFLDKESQIIRLQDAMDENDADSGGMVLPTKKGMKRITIENPDTKTNNAILDELMDFYEAIAENKDVSVSIDDGYNALKLAHQIQDQVDAANVILDK